MKRVLETAKKLGIPIVVTDFAGSESFVILPLQQFEAMAEGTKRSKRLHEVEEKNAGANGSAPEGEILFEGAESVEREIPIEDRFYLEPLEESGR